MTTIININGKDVEITLTPEQVEQIQQASKPKLFEYEKENTFAVGVESILQTMNGTDTNTLKYGRYRRTKEAAEIDFKRQTRMMRLSALAWEVGECVEADKRYYIYTHIYHNKCIYRYSPTSETTVIPGCVYMTYETAHKVCNMLNSGEYSLDVD